MTKFTPAQVLSAFNSAKASRTMLAQRDCKSVTARAICTLIPKSADSPTLWATGLGKKRIGGCRVEPHESMLDIAVYDGRKDPLRALWTAESEGKAGHYLAPDATSENSDYGWDLFKLLQVPSPRRLFVMRTAGCHHPTAWQLINTLVHAYSRSYGNGDRIYAIILPTAARDSSLVECRGWEGTEDGVRKLERGAVECR